MQFRRTKKASTAMDMGPLLDCVLQLLIFFMLSSTFLSPKISIALPRATTPQGTTDPRAVLVTAGEGGELFINQNRVELGGLEAALKPLIVESPDGAVTFRGDQNIPYHLFVQVMDASRRAGARQFNIAHDLEPGGADGP